jgi:hypothetical protein
VNRREFMTSAFAGAAGLARASRAASQSATAPDLAALAESGRFMLFNRTAQPLVDGSRRGVRLSEAGGEGSALIPGIAFSSGTIEVDLRGRNVAQRSFLGIAFHATDRTAYDAIYFRPFNFRAADPVSRGHAVQYHSLPTYTWDRLRADHPGQYEAAVHPVPDPNEWFRARIVVAGATVRVFVADAQSPSLVVDTLNGRTTGLVGLWVGNTSNGDFANLTILSG